MNALKTGKKVRRPNPRRSLNADNQAILIIEKFADIGAIVPGGFYDQGVIESWYVENTLGFTAPEHDDGMLNWDADGNIIPPKGAIPFERTALAAIAGDDAETAFNPRRWFDTTVRLRKYMLLYGVKGDPNTHRPLTIWIGKDMIAESRRTGKPLAKMLHKRLSDRLRRLLGAGNFGIWLNIEVSDKAAYALHAHGLLYVKDARYLVDDSKERDALVRELMDGSDADESQHPPNWVRFTKKDLNKGWIEYCRKARRDRLYRISAKEPPTDIGKQLEAGTHTLRGQARDFYDRSRLLVRALSRGELPEWSPEDWARITGPSVA